MNVKMWYLNKEPLFCLLCTVGRLSQGLIVETVSLALLQVCTYVQKGQNAFCSTLFFVVRCFIIGFDFLKTPLFLIPFI